MKPGKYIPIDCNFYDRLEAWATLGTVIEMNTAGDERLKGRIVNLSTRKGVEYLQMQDGVELRLDEIKSINGISPFNNCQIAP